MRNVRGKEVIKRVDVKGNEGRKKEVWSVWRKNKMNVEVRNKIKG